MLALRLDRLPAACLLFVLTASTASSKLVRVTIDDTTGDPVTRQQIEYSPDWSMGHVCQQCRVKLDQEKVYMGTWHDATSSAGGDLRSANVRFQGTSVWVKAILAGIQHAENFDGVEPEYYFFINGSHVGTFERAARRFGGDGFAYNETVFEDTDLPIGEHELEIRAGSGARDTLLLLDSVVYEYDDGTSDPDELVENPPSKEPSSSSNDNTLLIIAAVVPSVVALLSLITIAFLILYIRRLRRSTHSSLSPSTNASSQYLHPNHPVPPTHMHTTPFTAQTPNGSQAQLVPLLAGPTKPSLQSSSRHPSSSALGSPSPSPRASSNQLPLISSRGAGQPEGSSYAPSTMPPAYGEQRVLMEEVGGGRGPVQRAGSKARYTPGF